MTVESTQLVLQTFDWKFERRYISLLLGDLPFTTPQASFFSPPRGPEQQ